MYNTLSNPQLAARLTFTTPLDRLNLEGLESRLGELGTIFNTAEYRRRDAERTRKYRAAAQVIAVDAAHAIAEVEDRIAALKPSTTKPGPAAFMGGHSTAVEAAMFPATSAPAPGSDHAHTFGCNGICTVDGCYEIGPASDEGKRTRPDGSVYIDMGRIVAGEEPETKPSAPAAEPTTLPGFIIDVPVTLTIAVRGTRDVKLAKRIARDYADAIQYDVHDYMERSRDDIPAGITITEASLESSREESCNVLEELEPEETQTITTEGVALAAVSSVEHGAGVVIMPSRESQPGASSARVYDAFEIHPVVGFVIPGDKKETCEQCDSWDDAVRQVESGTAQRAFWTLYGHCTGDGLEAIADVETEEAARIMLYKLTGIIATEGNHGPYMAQRGGVR